MAPRLRLKMAIAHKADIAEMRRGRELDGESHVLKQPWMAAPKPLWTGWGGAGQGGGGYRGIYPPQVGRSAGTAGGQD